MKLEGEAVTVCHPSVPGVVDWSGLGLIPRSGDQNKLRCRHQRRRRSKQRLVGLHHVDYGIDLKCDPIDVSGGCQCEEIVSLTEFAEGTGDNAECPTIIMNMAIPQRLSVGYALTAKKTQSFLKPTLIALARSKGITFVVIDLNRPLDEQGPFDVILHKLSGELWQQQLKIYKQRNPGVMILDPPEAISRVYNRQSMLQEVASLNFCHPQGRVGVPKQLVVGGDPAFISQKVAMAQLKFPLVAKPLWIDGSANSHALSIAFNDASLFQLTPPLVLQEFVNHGGVLFKVYSVGHIVKVVRRFSLSDVCENQYRTTGLISFPRVSCAAASADDADLDPNVGELPPQEMLQTLCGELRSRLGLNLFNLDMIREGGKGNQYYVIDINYFPGYGKMPEYETVFTEFLCSLAQKKAK